MTKNLSTIFIVLLLLFLIGLKIKSGAKSSYAVDSLIEQVSLYYPELPEKYQKAIKNNDSTFYCATIENPVSRELIIIKNTPENIEKNNNFDLIIFYDKSLKKTKIKNGTPVVYRYKNKTYGILKKHLPLTYIQKIIIKQKKWADTINQPFSQLPPTDLKKITLSNTGTKKIPNPYLPLFTNALNNYHIKHLPYSYSKENNKLYQVFTDLDNYIKQENQTIGTLNNFSDLSKIIDKQTQEPLKILKFEGKNQEKATALINQYIDGKKNLTEVFDISKLNVFTALKKLFSDNCNQPFFLIYNPKNNILEPFFSYSDCLGELFTTVKQPKVKNYVYLENYLKSLHEITLINIDNLIENNKNLKNELQLINQFYTDKIFNEDILKLNQTVIRKSLDLKKMLITELVNITPQQIYLQITNLSNFPVSISGLNFKNKKILNINRTIAGKSSDTLIEILPKNFENLFVRKKSKNTGFQLYKDIYKMRISYGLLGFSPEYKDEIIPYVQNEKLNKEDLFRNPIEIEKNPDIKIDKKNKIISLNNNKIILTNALRIPQGYIFKLNNGNEIDIKDGGKIISFSPLQFEGSQKNPIRIYSSDEKGQGLVVFADGQKSKLQYVIFDKLSNPEHGYWNVSGAITFYESPVELNHVSFLNNASEDALNIVRTSFIMKYCDFKNTQSDAFDGDFVNGELNDCRFINSGNDAVDVSGSDISLNKVLINKTGDKGLSAGEKSIMKVKNLSILNGEIGVASKDLSTILIDYILIKNTKLAFTAFQKKPEFGPSKIIVKKADLKNIEKLYLIENNSVLSIEGKEVETIKNVKSKMYGVEFGVSSKVTRNKNRKK